VRLVIEGGFDQRNANTCSACRTIDEHADGKPTRIVWIILVRKASH
jgi:hypothetical protein